MTTYHPYKVNLSEGQKQKLAKAYKTNSPITLRLNKNQTSGNDELLLTANQIKRINKANSLRNGAEINISKTQIRKVLRQGGSLFSAVVPLVKTLGPTLAKTLGLSALAGLASEGASQLVKKISGKGQVGGFLILQDKIKKQIDNKHLLTNKQKQEILNALQSGGQEVIMPSPKHSGGALGTILASIGIPLALEAVKNMFGKGRPQGRGAPRMGAPITSKPKGKGRPTGRGAPRLGMYKLLGWEMKKKSKERKGTSVRTKQLFQQSTNSRGNII